MAGFSFLQKKNFHPGTFANIERVKQAQENERLKVEYLQQRQKQVDQDEFQNTILLQNIQDPQQRLIQENQLQWMYDYKPKNQAQKNEEFLLGKKIENLESFKNKYQKQTAQQKEEKSWILRLNEDPLVRMKQQEALEKKEKEIREMNEQNLIKN